MSDVTIDATVIKSTQDILGKYVKKPVLSEKLLKKPPFRFLHDVINTVIRDTGCFEGLYTPEELNFQNITDRNGKMQFLQKMIDALKIATNEPLNAKPSKIVAGHEPEKTNELLQLLGSVIENKIDWKNAVETVSTGVLTPIPKSNSKEKVAKEKKTVDKSSPKEGVKKSDSDKHKADVKEKTKSRDSKDVKAKTSRKLPKSTDADKKEQKKVKSKSSREPSKKPSPVKAAKTPAETSIPEHDLKSELKSDESAKLNDKPSEKDTMEQEQIQIRIKDNHKSEIPAESGSPPEEFKRDERRASKRAEEILLAAASEDTNGTDSRRSSGSKRPSARSRRSSAEKTRSSKPDDIIGKTSSDPTEALKPVAEEPSPESIDNPSLKSQPSQDSTQNSDVKRESTFVRENSKEGTQNPTRPRTSLRPPSARPASARPGAPRRRDKNIEIILQPNDQVKLSNISVKLETFNSELEDDGENLVIIENPNTEDPLQESLRNKNTEREDDSAQQGHLVQQILETQKELVQGGSNDTEHKLDKDYDMAKLNSRQSSARQMNSLRDVIQNLTKSVNPLGKLMDFIPEDIDAMQLELTMWRDTYNQSSVELKKERSLTESVTEPMKNQLVTIESTIKEYHEMIDGSRAKILQNTEKIQRLLTTQ